MLYVPPNIQIPDAELQFSFVRSSGPGGQNVNKVNTKAVLRWALADSVGLPAGVRHRFLARYGNRVTTEGELVLSSQRFRDQAKNQQDCLDKLAEMLRQVALPPKPRKKTKPTKASVRRRLTKKTGHSQKKAARRKPSLEE